MDNVHFPWNIYVYIYIYPNWKFSSRFYKTIQLSLSLCLSLRSSHNLVQNRIPPSPSISIIYIHLPISLLYSPLKSENITPHRSLILLLVSLSPPHKKTLPQTPVYPPKIFGPYIYIYNSPSVNVYHQPFFVKLTHLPFTAKQSKHPSA